MWWFIVAIILAIIGIALVIWKDIPQPSTGSPPFKVWRIGVAVLILALIALIVACTTRIGTKEVGVVTSFGKIARCDLESGIHLKLPWQKVTQLDGTIQTDKFHDDTAIGVRINDGSTAAVSATIRWRIDPADACSLYQDYRSNNVDENIADALVRTQFTASAASVFSDFDPLLEIQQTNTNPASTNTATGINLDEYSDDLSNALDEHLAAASPTDTPEVEVVSVTISYLTLAQTTQDRLNQYQAEVAKTRIAAQAIQTARNNAKANRVLATSVSKDPNVLVSKCLDTLTLMVEQKEASPVPPGFTCWPGGDTGSLVFSK